MLRFDELEPEALFQKRENVPMPPLSSMPAANDVFAASSDLEQKQAAEEGLLENDEKASLDTCFDATLSDDSSEGTARQQAPDAIAPTAEQESESDNPEAPQQQAALPPAVIVMRPVDRKPNGEGDLMSEQSGYKDLSKVPVLGDEPDFDSETSFTSGNRQTATLNPPASSSRPSVQSASLGSLNRPQLSLDHLNEARPAMETEISGNVQTLIRLVSELPEGVTKQNGAQIIRLTMEAMGIPMEDVLGEAQKSQSELLEAVRANLKKIEEFKAVIRKLEGDIKHYQGKANELSEIIDLFIMSSPAAAGPNLYNDD